RVDDRILRHEQFRLDERSFERHQRTIAELAARPGHGDHELHDGLMGEDEIAGDQTLSQYFRRDVLLDRIPRVEAINQDVRVNEACHGYTDPRASSPVSSRARREAVTASRTPGAIWSSFRTGAD